MQFTSKLASFVALVAYGVAQVAAVPFPSGVATESQMLTWLSTTDANITYIGTPPNKNGKRQGGNVMVTTCNLQKFTGCGGSCTVYNGPSICLETPGTQCLSATANVAFCDKGNCGGSCNELDTCGDKLDANFCATPGTSSVFVPIV